MLKTPRLNMPLLAVGQAQKELTHNEALTLLDFLVQPTCLGSPANLAPAAPTVGASYLVGPAPTGEWAGHADAFAHWTASGWRFSNPVEGCKVTSLPDGYEWRFLEGAWSKGLIDATVFRVEGQPVVGRRRPAITSPAGGSVIDTEGRVAINAILDCLRGHGLIAT